MAPFPLFPSRPLTHRQENLKMARNEKTSKRVGKTASTILRSKKSSKAAKSVAGSALTQRPDRRRQRK